MTSRPWSLPLAVVLGALALFASFAATPAQRAYATPLAAAQALHEAVRAGDRAAISAVLGPGSADVIDAGDEAEDRAGRERFVASYEQSAHIEWRGKRHAWLVIGPQEWHFPFPLVRTVAGWRFDARAGRDEVIARRIGRNELAAIQAVLAFVDAQRDYALAPHDGSGPGLYAQRIASTPGRHDGLYWTPTREDALSPLGAMFALAAADEPGAERLRPYHGYFFRMLRGQGAHAEGGTSDYVVGGRMIGGFALVAYPARHRVTGVRTFIVSHRGVVYSRDLGPRTQALARAMTRFDPDRSWRRETVASVPSEQDDPMRRLAGDRGCTLCHREAPSPRASNGVVPLAPSWREIATRYRGRAQAEESLTRTVIEGADPSDRHWSNRIEFTAMQANAGHVSPDEARALVRWILSSP